jgi:hypothetical protein
VWFEDSTAVSMKNAVLWDVIGHLVRTSVSEDRLHHQGGKYRRCSSETVGSNKSRKASGIIRRHSSHCSQICFGFVVCCGCFRQR